MADAKPYRPNVGVALFNVSGEVLIGRRFKDDGPEIVLPGLEWQMPQGGIDTNENPREAVMRELSEETRTANAEYPDATHCLDSHFPDLEPVDRDHMAIAVALRAIVERVVDGILFACSLERQPGTPRGADRDRVPAGGGLSELMRDIVPRICRD